MAIAGVWLIEILQHNYGEDEVNKVVLGMVASALLVVGVATLIRALFLRDVIPERYAMHLYRRHIIAAVITGATTGFVIGLTSAGSGTLIAIVLIAVFRLTPQRVVGTDVFHAAILLWAAGIAHWVGGNVDFGLAANILVGSIPGVLIGSQLAVKVPTGLLRNALGVVLIASAITLITKEHVPKAVLIPSISVAALVIVALFAIPDRPAPPAHAAGRGQGARRGSQSGRLTPAPGGGSGWVRCPVDFELSPRVSDLRDRVRAFMDEHVYPVELEAMRALDDEVAARHALPARSSSRSAPRPARRASGTSSCRTSATAPGSPTGSTACSARRWAAAPRSPRWPSTARRPTRATWRSSPSTAPRSSGPMARSAARRRHPLLLLDDRARGLRLRPDHPATRAELDDGEWVINGHKWFTSGAVGASVAIVDVRHRSRRPPVRAGVDDPGPHRQPGLQPDPPRSRSWATTAARATARSATRTAASPRPTCSARARPAS